MLHTQNSATNRGSQPPHPTRACPTAHISPRPEENQFFRYKTVVYAGMVETQEIRPTPSIRVGGGKRGPIVGLSRAARRRALQTLCKVRGEQNGLFLTLTYPDEFPKARQAYKRDLDVFLKRLTRQYSGVGFFWRLEYQRRKSGEHQGELAPHFHLLLFGVSADVPSFRTWVAQAWFESNRAADVRNRRAGTEVSPIRSRRHAMHYASKYVAKADEEAIREEIGETGRMWGYGGVLDTLPYSTLVLSRDEFVNLRRLVKSWLRSRRSDYARRLKALEHGFTVMGLGDQCADELWGRQTIFRMLPRPPTPYTIV